jgi:hypothetical protein
MRFRHRPFAFFLSLATQSLDRPTKKAGFWPTPSTYRIKGDHSGLSRQIKAYSANSAPNFKGALLIIILIITKYLFAGFSMGYKNVFPMLISF